MSLYRWLAKYVQAHMSVVRGLAFHASFFHLWAAPFLCLRTGPKFLSSFGTLLWFILYVLPWGLAGVVPSRGTQIVLSLAIYSAIIPHTLWAARRLLGISSIKTKRALVQYVLISGALASLSLFMPIIPFKPEYGVALLNAFPVLPFRNAFLGITIPGVMPPEMPLYVHISYIVVGGIIVPLTMHIYLFYFVACIFGTYRLMKVMFINKDEVHVDTTEIETEATKTKIAISANSTSSPDEAY